jgi:hypothetical protein
MNKLINQFKLQSGLYQLKLVLKKINKAGHSIPLIEAKSIGLLFSISTENEIKEIEEIVRALKSTKKNVQIMGFVSDKTLKIAADCDIKLLTTDDISWNYIPKTEKISQFIKQEFDILINHCTEICVPLSFVTALSKSTFKVGAFQSNQITIFDLTLVTEQKSITGFSNELKHYLDKIR